MGLPTNISLPFSSCPRFAVELSTKLLSMNISVTFSGEYFLPRQTNSPTVILFSVSVPVLSEHITLMHPTVSHATIFLTSAFCLAIFITLSASDTATMVGSPSGTDATISTMLVMNTSCTLSKLTEFVTNSVIMRIVNTAAAAIAPSKVIILPSLSSLC